MLSRALFGKENKYNKGVDIWTVGVFAYELCTGRAPFEAKTHEKTQQRIHNVLYSPHSNFSSDLKDFINRILVHDPEKRASLVELLDHPWIVSNRTLDY